MVHNRYQVNYATNDSSKTKILLFLLESFLTSLRRVISPLIDILASYILQWI